MTSNSMVHLHVHSEFSILDGLGTVEDYVARAAELEQPAIALTDHGVLCGAPSFYHAARKAGVEPILGEEFYFTEDAAWRPTKGNNEDTSAARRFHVVILAKGNKGYKVLSELSTASNRQFYYKPLIDRAMIEGMSDSDRSNLVVLSGCAGSAISVAARNDGYEAAVEEMYWWREMFPHFYIELQHHNTEFDRELNDILLQVAKRHEIPWVITNDPHYVVPEDDCHHDALLAIQTASDVDDPERFRFDGTGYHLRSRKEMYNAFKQYGLDVWKPGVAETLKIAKACKTRIPQWETRTWHIPKMPGVDDAQAEMERLTYEGLEFFGKAEDDVYTARAAHELSVMGDVGIADFMLITRWCIEQAILADIPVGPGRGSVCGTLVGYCLGIHKIDPIKYDLMFERFLNPARPRMPDIDTDFGQKDRTKIFGIVEDFFGPDNVVGVAAYGRMMYRKAFQSLGKAHGISFQQRMEISKDLPKVPEEGIDLLPADVAEAYPGLMEQLDRLQGTRSELKGHPAGVIIADPSYKIRQLVPEMWLASSKKMCGQYDLDAIEEMGLMKEDFLGLRTLDTIKLAVKFIYERTGERLDPDSWQPDDEEGDDRIYAMLAAGGTSGVFQMEGGTNTAGIKAIGPTQFEDIVSCTALYRTGPILAGYPKAFLHNREVGKRRINYVHSLLKPILERTWGVILYQEQVMEIGRVLAGFDNAGEDEIKEAIKHKKSQVMDELRPLFVKGCKDTNNIPRSISTAIWKDIEGYAGYSYNRSHAVAYTFLTYQTARLRCMHPVEFFAALLATVEDSDKIDHYRRDCVAAGIKLRKPCVNRSGPQDIPEGDNAIRFGLSAIKGVGPAATGKLASFRSESGRFTEVDEVIECVRNAGVVNALRDSGALASLGVEGDIAVAEKLLNWRWRDGMKRYRDRYRDTVDFPSEDGDSCTLIGEIIRATKGKTKAGNKEYMTWTVAWSPNVSWNVRLWSETSAHWTAGVGSIVRVMGKWEAKWDNVSVGNSRMVKVIKRAD